MTNREREILKLIENNPMITQEEIAQELYISRTAVATHIHNLLKKGYIKGRGYILNSQSNVTVIGGINMDIVAVSKSKVLKDTSNPGTIKHYLGGAGRNSALALTKLNLPNNFISVYGNDVYGNSFLSDARKNGIDIGMCQEVENGNTSTYVYIEDLVEDYSLGVDDMDIIKELTPQVLSRYISRINQSNYCILDNSLSRSSLEYLCENLTMPIILNSVSVNKLDRVINILDKVEILLLHAQDLYNIMDLLGKSEYDIDQSIKYLNNLIEHIIIVSPTEGLIYSSKKKYIQRSLNFKTEFNTNGCSSVTAATVAWGVFYNYSWEEIISFSINAMKSSLSTNESIHPNFSKKRLLEE